MQNPQPTKTYLVRRGCWCEVYMVALLVELSNPCVKITPMPAHIPLTTIDMLNDELVYWSPGAIVNYDGVGYHGHLFSLPFHSGFSKRRFYRKDDRVLVAWKQSKTGRDGCVVNFVAGLVLASDAANVSIRYWFSATTPRDATVPRNCIYMYNWQTLHANCRAAVRAWFLCARRAQLVCKDVARLMVRLVWETRDDAEWEREEQDAKKRLRL